MSNSQETDPDYIPSQTPSSEDYVSVESSSQSSLYSDSQYSDSQYSDSQYSDSRYSIASSGKCSGSSDYNSSYFDETDSCSSSQSSY